MGGLFSLTPTFTQGFVLGQISILVIVVLIVQYLLFESPEQTKAGLTAALPPKWDRATIRRGSDDDDKAPESPDVAWLNMILRMVADAYRQKLRANLPPGTAGDEQIRIRIEDFVNRTLGSAGFLDHITVHSVDLGSSAPRLSHAHLTSSKAHFDISYSDTLSITLSTAYILHQPVPNFARLPVSLSISLGLFKSPIILSSSGPALTISLDDSVEPHLELRTTSLMGARAKLTDVPKLHALIEMQIMKVLKSRGSWTFMLPGLAHSKDEPISGIEKEANAKVEVSAL